jgi:hypothetical protein
MAGRNIAINPCLVFILQCVLTSGSQVRKFYKTRIDTLPVVSDNGDVLQIFVKPIPDHQNCLRSIAGGTRHESCLVGVLFPPAVGGLP